MMKEFKAPSLVLQYLLAGCCLLASGYLLAALNLPFNLTSALKERQSVRSPTACTEIVKPKATLSRSQLARLLTVPERSSRRNVQQIVKEPYCRLPNVSIRAGAKTEREIHPLAFDPQTSLVVLYEGETYVGYGFKRP
ncbi:hypothetical protein H6F74_08805 [Trichocoleus sp. FACHB-90]|nr:hypothetical protein [Trichocoleus sp. FACHB-90]